MTLAYIGTTELLIVGVIFLPGLVLFVALVRFLWLRAKR